MSKSFSQLRSELNEVSARVEPTINDLNTNPSKDMGWIRSKNIPKALPSPTKTTLSDVGKSILSAGGRLATKYGPAAAAGAASLAGGYQAGKLANDISAVNKVTDKVGKGIASGLQKMGIGKPPEVVKAKEREVSRKPADTGPKTSVPAQSGGGMVSFPKPTVDTKSEPVKPTVAPVSKPIKSEPVKSNAVAPVKNNSSVKQLQQNLIKKGANIKADGIMGPKTRAAMKSFSAPVNKSAAPATKPAAPVNKSAAPATKPAAPANKSAAPVKKSIPTTRKAEADPNTGKGFVTARSNISKSGEIINPKNRFGSGNKQTFMTPTPRKDVIASGAKAVPQKPASEKSTGTASVPRTSKKNVSGGKWV